MPAKKIASLPKADLARIEAIRKKVEAMEKEMVGILKAVAKRDSKRA